MTMRLKVPHFGYRRQNPRAASAVAVTVAVLSITSCATNGPASRRYVHFTTASYSVQSQVAAASEYAVIATVTNAATPYALAAEPALRYWVANARITKVIGQRPDVKTRLTAGMTIAIGTELLNADQRAAIANFSELAAEFPTEVDVPQAGEQIVAFLVHDQLAGFGDGYAAIGQATLSASQQVRFRALPGSLSHKTTVGSAGFFAGIKSDLAGPAPWRQVDPATGTAPPTSGAPASAPTP